MSSLFLHVTKIICAVWPIAFKLYQLCRPDISRSLMSHLRSRVIVSIALGLSDRDLSLVLFFFNRWEQFNGLT